MHEKSLLRAHFKTAACGARTDTSTPEIGQYLPKTVRPWLATPPLRQGFETHSYAAGPALLCSARKEPAPTETARPTPEKPTEPSVSSTTHTHLRALVLTTWEWLDLIGSR